MGCLGFCGWERLAGCSSVQRLGAFELVGACLGFSACLGSPPHSRRLCYDGCHTMFGDPGMRFVAAVIKALVHASVMSAQLRKPQTL